MLDISLQYICAIYRMRFLFPRIYFFQLVLYGFVFVLSALDDLHVLKVGRFDSDPCCRINKACFLQTRITATVKAHITATFKWTRLEIWPKMFAPRRLC